MGSVTIDEKVVAILSGLKEETLLRDKSGKVIGRFKPAEDEAERHAKAALLFTEEDIEAARRSVANKEPGSPLAEVWKRIRGEGAK